MVENIRDYIFNKIFAPRTFIIDQPGIIYNVLAKKYGRGESKKRIIWYFEDTLANLQIATIKKLGFEKTNKLWYEIGKDTGLRYLLLSKAKTPPQFLTSTILNYILSANRAGGMSIAEKINYKNKKLTLEGVLLS